MACRINHKTCDFLNNFSGKRIKERDGFQFIIKKLKSNRHLGVFGRENINSVSPDAEGAASEIHFTALVLHANELGNKIRTTFDIACSHNQTHLRVTFRLTDTVDCRDSGHNNGVTALKNAFGGSQAHLLDVLIDCRIFFYEKIPTGNIGFRLIVVVIRNEVFHRVIGKKFPHFRIQLRGQRFIRSHDQGRHALTGDDVSHRKCFTRPGYPQQCLKRQTALEPLV